MIDGRGPGVSFNSPCPIRHIKVPLTQLAAWQSVAAGGMLVSASKIHASQPEATLGEQQKWPGWASNLSICLVRRSGLSLLPAVQLVGKPWPGLTLPAAGC